MKAAMDRLKGLRVVAEVRRAEERAKAFTVLQIAARQADVEERKAAGSRRMAEHEAAWEARLAVEPFRPELLGGGIAQSRGFLEAASTLTAEADGIEAARVRGLAQWRETLSRQSVAADMSAFAERQVARKRENAALDDLCDQAVYRNARRGDET